MKRGISNLVISQTIEPYKLLMNI